MTSKQCVKVAQLRKKGYTDFESWLKTDDNVYVGLSGRIRIHGDNKRIFNKGSKWSNPFKVTKECSLEESLTQYIDYIVESGLIHDIHELKGKTWLLACVLRLSREYPCRDCRWRVPQEFGGFARLTTFWNI